VSKIIPILRHRLKHFFQVPYLENLSLLVPTSFSLGLRQGFSLSAMKRKFMHYAYRLYCCKCKCDILVHENHLTDTHPYQLPKGPKYMAKFIFNRLPPWGFFEDSTSKRPKLTIAHPINERPVQDFSGN